MKRKVEIPIVITEFCSLQPFFLAG